MTDYRSRRDFLRKAWTVAAGTGLATHFSTDALAAHPEWKAGCAEVIITPQNPLWMAGYAARTKPSEGTYQDLHAKALALEDDAGHRAVLVTSDLLGFPGAITANIFQRVEKHHHLKRDELLLSSSHTHTGPVIGKMLPVAYPMTERQWADVAEYTAELETKVVNVVGMALKSLQPARLSFGHGEAGFAKNRRTTTSNTLQFGVNPKGPVDHDVPVLRVDGHDGKLRAVVFGYACHNTSATEYMKFGGDYAGFAQAQLESNHPGALALFMMGCGGDANPYPRGTLEITRQHGEELAAAVEKVLAGELSPLRAPLKTGYEEFPLAFATPPSRQELQDQLQNGDVYHRRWAALMLKILDADGHLPTEHSYPLEIWRFGEDLTLIAMAGEVVVDYDLRLKKEFGAEKLWVAGYCNDVFAYIPSLRVLREGGYEGGGAMIYYGQPGPFAPTVEETIDEKVHELMQRVRGESS